MATDPVGESRDVGTLLHGERQVLEMIATGVPLAAVLGAMCRVIDQRSGLISAVFLVDGDTFAVYCTAPGFPSELHLQDVGRATHLASIAVERHLTEQALRDSELRFRQIAGNGCRSTPRAEGAPWR